MEPTELHPETDAKPGDSYLWAVPGKPVQIKLELDVVDRLSIEVMQGFGAVPKRGAEVGGLLLGTVERVGSSFTVHIEEFVPVPVEYSRGPSYLLSENDRPKLLEAVAKNYSPLQLIGLYRSNTREAFALTPEDIALAGELTPEPHHVMLLIRPFATKVSIAGFFFRENGKFSPSSSLLEFPFRRRELGGGTPLPRRAVLETAEPPEDPEVKRVTRVVPDEESELDDALTAVPFTEHRGLAGSEPFVLDDFPDDPPARGWRWWMLALGVLILCGAFGFEAVTKLGPLGSSHDPYALHLHAEKQEGGYLVSWDTSAPAIQAAQRGGLFIDDAHNQQRVDLTPAQLRSGSLIYKALTESIVFRLEVSPAENTTVLESVSVNLKPAELGGAKQAVAPPPEPEPTPHRRGRRSHKSVESSSSN